jgi:hypothetical protein
VLPAAADATVTTTGFDVGCDACWMPPAHVPAGLLEPLVAAHRLPVLLTIHIRYRGRQQVWICRRPRPLSR